MKKGLLIVCLIGSALLAFGGLPGGGSPSQGTEVYHAVERKVIKAHVRLRIIRTPHVFLFMKRPAEMGAPVLRPEHQQRSVRTATISRMRTDGPVTRAFPAFSPEESHS